MVPVNVGWALSVAPAAIATVGLIGGYATTGITSVTTAVTPAQTMSYVSGKGKASSSCTLVGTPMWVMQLMGGFTAAALPSSPQVSVDLNGQFIIPPGGYMAIGTLTATTGLGHWVWEEVPLS